LQGSHFFRPHERLRSSAEYQRVKRVGKRLRTPHLGVNYAANGRDYHRLGLVVQKRFWNAVQRNRIKRCLRESFRLHKGQIPLPGKDIVIIARPGANQLSSPELAREVLKAFARQDGRSI
jgi:ribonuclease P protein component